MTCVAIIGGGLAGCASAYELAKKGINTVIIEKSNNIGGKVINYGCKATNACNNCGLCLVKDLWERVKERSEISILTNAIAVDMEGEKGNYKITVKENGKTRVINNIDSVIVSTGFDNFSLVSLSNLEMDKISNVITGSKLEEIIAHRDGDPLFEGLLPHEPSNIAFIQCFGSRDLKERADYCSRVCCGYSTRMAKVIHWYYPNAKITFFYMDLQWVGEKNYFSDLINTGIEFIMCKPIEIIGGVSGTSAAKIKYEDLQFDGVSEREFDVVVLSEGIHACSDSSAAAEIFGLKQDKNGFLKHVIDPLISGVYIAGCAGGPKRIEEVYAESASIAREIWYSLMKINS